MKVQRRCDPKEVYEVLNESPTHYIIDRGYNDIALRKADYEPVQEWVIVPIDSVYRDTEGRACNKGTCNSYFFADKDGNFLTSDHEPIIIDGKVGLRRRKQ
jgi:hypothetical protein